MMRIFLNILTALTLLCSSQLFAAGLGKSTLHSALGEKLFIEIPVMGASTLSKEQILFSIAPVDAYKQLGVEFLQSHLQLRFATISDDQGNLTLLVTSPQPVNEPSLDFVIEMNTPTGRLVKEVSVLLDTPEK